ncbi:MAG: response regulator, partial [Promethearchaeota archaeon]
MENDRRKIDFLIIEDDYETVNLLKTYIEAQGFTCEHVSNVMKGLEILKSIMPSIILLDILLPGKKGHEIIKPIKSNMIFNDVLIYILTAIPRSEALDIMEKYGADGVISKPFDIE